MDKEEVLLEIKKIGFDLAYNKITYKEYKDKMDYLIRYQWKK